MKISFSVLFLALWLPCAGAAEKKSAASGDPSKTEAQTQLQIFLDRANFGPGKIDGRDGEFTRKALARYRAAQGLPEANQQQALDGIDIQSVQPVFTQYTVTAEDVSSAGELPKEKPAQAKLKWLPYATVVEAVAERFHSDVDFVRELNPKVNTAQLKEGDILMVPNVEPFELVAVKNLKVGKGLEAVGEKVDSEKEKESTRETKEKETRGEGNASKLAIHISTKDNILEVLDDQKMIAAFPVTCGSDEIPTPIGDWKVKGVTKLPPFRYDKKMLNQGERSEDYVMLPPGPNSPVGIVWIALNKKGIGIHGTDDPDSIGRSASHGCIRLANWDAVRLAQMVQTGTPVKID